MFSNCKLIHRLFSAYLSLQIGKGIVGVSCLWFIFFTEKCLLEIAYLFNYIDSFGKWNENNCNEWVSVCAKHWSLFSFRNTTITMSMLELIFLSFGCGWGQSGELEGSEFRCYVTMITMLNTLLPLRTPSTLPIRHMVYS